MNKNIALIYNGNVIHGAKVLCTLLNENQNIAIKGSWMDILYDRCDMASCRGSGFYFPGFGVNIGIFEVQIGPDELSWTIVGPGDNFRLNFGTFGELKKQIMHEVNKDPTRVGVEIDMFNKDGNLMSPGAMGYMGTWYCGKFKEKTGFILFNDENPCPEDKICGPKKGMQCVACKWSQDLQSISSIDQSTCHIAFEKLFKGKETLADLFEGTVHNMKICNGYHKTNSGFKAIFMTALEILHENASRNTYNIIGIEDMKITMGSAECIVNMIRQGGHGSHVQGGHGSQIDEGGSGLGTPPIYKLYLNCVTTKLPPPKHENEKPLTFRGYKGIYTNCTMYMFI